AAGFDPAIRWFESSRPCHFPPVMMIVLGASPSGKAAGFDPAIRWKGFGFIRDDGWGHIDKCEMCDAEKGASHE
ncbi:hypothetical protein ACSRDJ_19510, partial [Acinetobacter baumannii]